MAPPARLARVAAHLAPPEQQRPPPQPHPSPTPAAGITAVAAAAGFTAAAAEWMRGVWAAADVPRSEAGEEKKPAGEPSPGIVERIRSIWQHDSWDGGDGASPAAAQRAEAQPAAEEVQDEDPDPEEQEEPPPAAPSEPPAPTDDSLAAAEEILAEHAHWRQANAPPLTPRPSAADDDEATAARLAEANKVLEEHFSANPHVKPSGD